MARTAKGAGRVRREDEAALKDAVTYFFLTKYADTWSALPITEKKALQDSVTQKVTDEGGSCRLFATHGSDCDSVSMISGVSAAGALRIAEHIQLCGHRKTTCLPGLHIFKD